MKKAKEYNIFNVGLTETRKRDNFTDEKINEGKPVLYIKINNYKNNEKKYFKTELKNIQEIITYLDENSIKEMKENPEKTTNWIYSKTKSKSYSQSCPSCNKKPPYEGATFVRKTKHQGDRNAEYMPSLCLRCYKRVKRELIKINEDLENGNLEEDLLATYLA